MKKKTHHRMEKIKWIMIAYFLILNGNFINVKSKNCIKTSEPLTGRNPRPIVGKTFFASKHLLNSQNANLDYFKSVFTVPDNYSEIIDGDEIKNITANNIIFNVRFLNSTAHIVADEIWLRSARFCYDTPFLHNVKRLHFSPKYLFQARYTICPWGIDKLLETSDTSLLKVLDLTIRKEYFLKLEDILKAVSDAQLEVLSINGLSGCITVLREAIQDSLIVTKTIKYLALTNFANGFMLNRGFYYLFPCLQVFELSNTYFHYKWLVEILSFHPTLELLIDEDKTHNKLYGEFTLKDTNSGIKLASRGKRDATNHEHVCFGGKYRKGSWMADYDFSYEIKCDNTSGIVWNKTFQESTLKTILGLRHLPKVEGLYFKPDSSCAEGMRAPIAPKLQELYIQSGGLALALLRILKNNWWLDSISSEHNEVCLVQNSLKSFHVSTELYESVSEYLSNISTFSGLEQLSQLHLNQMSFNNIPEYLLKHKYFPNLTILNINRNNITFKEEFRLCNAFRSLANFSISSNGLSFMPVSMFRDCGNLTNLDLSFNILQTLPNKCFSGCKSLLTLDISFNLLRALPQSLFHGCGKLQFVDLSHNFLHRIPQTLTSELEDYHMLIDLSHNALSCDCHPDAIGTLLHLHNNKHRYHNHQTYQCNGLEDVQLILDINVEEYTRSCDKWLPHEVALLTTGCCAILVVFWLSIWLLIKCRYRVVTCMHRVRTCLKCGMRYENRPAVFAFDLYLVYCNEDREWVHRSLVDTLETKHGFNCCVHYRDFPGTGDIDEVILKYMRYSRDIVVILSRHSINKQWPSFEIKNAQHLERRHGKRIFYVKLGCLGENIPERVKRVLGSRIYMEWPEQETETSVSHFYEKLVASIYGKAMCGSCCTCFRAKEIVTP